MVNTVTSDAMNEVAAVMPRSALTLFVATRYVNDESRLEEAVKTLRGAIELGAEKPEHEPMVYDVIK